MKPSNISLVSVNEEKEMKAQKAFYEAIESEMDQKKARKLDFWKKVSMVYNPLFALIFVAVYWAIGLKHAGTI